MTKNKQESRIWYHVWQAMLLSMVLFGLTAMAAPQMAPASQQHHVQDMGEFAYSDSIYTAHLSGLINGFRVQNQEVTYSVVNGLPITEGDIILNFSGPTTMGLGLPQAETGRLWPGGLVPYIISPSLPNQQRIHDAIAHWEEHTSIRFVERTDANAKDYPNYIEFRPSFGCSSYVGMVGGKQPINLASACSTGNTIHEIGHALGLWHEQSRADRDVFVDVLYENIQPSMAFNFDKHVDDGEDMGEYDYGSIMHYPRWAFSKNGKDTIVPHGNQEIGQRKALSDGDITAIEYMYDRVRGQSQVAADVSLPAADSANASTSYSAYGMLGMGCDGY